MENDTKNEKPTGRPAFYAGRFFDRVADEPGEHDVLSDWDVLPTRLGTVLEQTSTLAVLDLFSFPFEAMTDDKADLPLILVLPPGFDAEFLTTVFGTPAFEPLGFFDRVATDDDALWEKLRRRYGWAEGQRLVAGGGQPEEVVREIGALLEAESAPPSNFFEGEEYDATRYWSERGDALANLSPHRAICSVHHDWRFNKAIHLAQAAILEPQFAAARGNRAESVPFSVLEIGTGVGRWAASFDLARTSFSGVDISAGMIEAARANFPQGAFERLGEDLILPYDDESFDLAFSVTVMHHNHTPAKRILLSEMWRVTRPGGRLMFLEDFAVGAQSATSTVYPMSVLKFVDLLLEATSGQVTLEHMESLQYPHDGFVRGGLLSLSRLGVPSSW
jgi:SAM-dependent methyltransferase